MRRIDLQDSRVHKSYKFIIPNHPRRSCCWCRAIIELPTLPPDIIRTLQSDLAQPCLSQFQPHRPLSIRVAALPRQASATFQNLAWQWPTHLLHSLQLSMAILQSLLLTITSTFIACYTKVSNS